MLSGRQGKLLLAYLVSVHGEPVRRDDLIDVVWQGRLPQAPEAALSSLLTGVRRAVGPTGLSGRSLVTLNLPAGTWIDVDQAREEARLADSALAGGAAADALRRACAGLELIERPALAELHGPWVERLRNAVDELRCDLLETAARAALACEEVVAAQRHARGLLELEPYREAGYGLLMEALARAGNVAEALRTFDRLRVMLRDELGVPPAPALTALHERLLCPGRPRAPAGRGVGAAAGADPPLRAPRVRGARTRAEAPARALGAGPRRAERARARDRRSGDRQDAPGRAVCRRGARRRRDRAPRPRGHRQRLSLPAARPGTSPSRRAPRPAGCRVAAPTASPGSGRGRGVHGRERAARAVRRGGDPRWGRRRGRSRSCSCSRTCTGPTSRPRCCCATSSATPTPRRSC